MGPVADSDSSFDGVRIEFVVATEVLEQSAVWGADSQLDIGKLLGCAEEANGVLGQHEGAGNSLMIKHIYYYFCRKFDYW